MYNWKFLKHKQLYYITNNRNQFLFIKIKLLFNPAYILQINSSFYTSILIFWGNIISSYLLIPN